MRPIYTLEDAGIEGPPGTVVTGLDWEVPSTGVTVILGPSGTGKTTILRALSGRLERASWQARGRWMFRGVPYDPTTGATLEGVHLCAQPDRTSLASRRSHPSWCDALEEAAASAVFLLDEPDRWFHPDEQDTLLRKLRARARITAVVVVTHDLSFARAVADHVVLVAGGRTIAQEAAGDFFDRPSSDLVARFLRDGNLWPQAPSPPRLPSHFNWVLPERLGGMAYPGLLGDQEEELEAIAHAGTTVLVSLTSSPFPREILRRFGIDSLHLPIADMQAPATRNAASVCGRAARVMTQGDAIVFHCQAGLGRTGLMLASVLVWMGRSPDDAVQKVRSVCPGYIQTDGQLQFVHEFAHSVGRG